jgi:hypothetical protein
MKFKSLYNIQILSIFDPQSCESTFLEKRRLYSSYFLSLPLKLLAFSFTLSTRRRKEDKDSGNPGGEQAFQAPGPGTCQQGAHNNRGTNK